ncbi:putative transcriptional regulator [Leptospira ryugenii]|uniref:Putative transcriptional regulator n=1 Tax=Leptospira ryugenii TaxID=1917863 RepID=A0A2P2E4X4_9LEPT|nr:putative transcriptional regulator [Leptospira ryugenii]
MIKFKHFSSMPSAFKQAFFSEEKGQDWLQNSLGASWEELCTACGFLSGVVVLRSEEEQSFSEVAAFGYGEEGFYYPFMASSGEAIAKLKSEPFPLSFSGSMYDLFHPEAEALALGIYGQENKGFIGFLLVEAKEIQSFAPYILRLFAEKISYEMLQPDSPIAAKSVERAPSSEPLLVPYLPDLEQCIHTFQTQKMITLYGEKGTGKRTLAKWIHESRVPGSAFLLVSSVPEHFGKFEKALIQWAAEVGGGSLAFVDASHWSLGQQKILLDWRNENPEPGLFFLEHPPFEKPEGLATFRQFLESNLSLLPSVSTYRSQEVSQIVGLFFAELAKAQNRPGLSLDPKVIVEMAKRSWPGNWQDIKNSLLLGILNCTSKEVSLQDVFSGKNQLQLGVPDSEDLDLRMAIQALERQKILNAKRIFSGNQIRMAKALGISRGALQNKMKQLDLL